MAEENCVQTMASCTNLIFVSYAVVPIQRLLVQTEMLQKAQTTQF